MVIKYTIDFASLLGKKYQVRIYDATTSATTKAVALLASTQSFTTDEGSSDDIYTPVRTQTGYIRFIMQDDLGDILADLMPEAATDRPVVLVEKNSDATETVRWVGFLTGEQFSQPWEPRPYEIELPVTSAIGAMSGIYFTQDDSFTSLHSLCSSIASYLPVPISFVFPDVIDPEAVVPNYNFQTYLTSQERYETSTSNTYDSATIADVLEYFCKYFGIACHESADTFYFFAHDAANYGSAKSTAYDISKLQVRSADNTASFTQMYTLAKGSFDIGDDKDSGEIIQMPQKFSEEFTIAPLDSTYATATQSLVVYNGNDYIQPYVDGVQKANTSVISTELSNGSAVIYQGGKDFGQIVSVAEVSADKYGNETDHKNRRSWDYSETSSYTRQWNDTFRFRICHGDAEVTLMKMKSKHSVFINPDKSTLFNLYIEVENDMPTDKRITKKFSGTLTPNLGVDGACIYAVYAKIKVGNYWLNSRIEENRRDAVNSPWKAEYFWSSEECECCLLLINNKQQYYKNSNAWGYSAFGHDRTSGGQSVTERGSFGGTRASGAAATNTSSSSSTSGASSETQASLAATYETLKGINIPFPDDVYGTNVDISVEFTSKVISDAQFMFSKLDSEEWYDYGNVNGGLLDTIGEYKLATFFYIQYLFSEFTIGLNYPSNSYADNSVKNSQNIIAIKLNNATNSKYEVTSAITTRRGVQHGTGLLLNADHTFATKEYDFIGMRRRAALLEKPHPMLKVTLEQTLKPIDTITWNGKTFVPLYQSIDWQDDENKVKLVAIK